MIKFANRQHAESHLTEYRFQQIKQVGFFKSETNLFDVHWTEADRTIKWTDELETALFAGAQAGRNYAALKGMLDRNELTVELPQ